MKIVELSDGELDYLIAVATTAKANGQTMKFAVDGGLKFKRGESMWTPPLGHDLKN